MVIRFPPVHADGFRGEVAAASLKHHHRVRERHGSVRFRGEVAAASLKQEDLGEVDGLGMVFPRRSRRGLIEARMSSGHIPSALVFPRRSRRGLIEAFMDFSAAHHSAHGFRGEVAAASLKRAIDEVGGEETAVSAAKSPRPH